MLNVLAEAAELDSCGSMSREESPSTSVSGDDVNCKENNIPRSTQRDPSASKLKSRSIETIRPTSPLSSQNPPTYEVNTTFEFPPRKSPANSNQPLQPQIHNKKTAPSNSLYYSYHERSKTAHQQAGTMSDDPLVSLLGPTASGGWTHSEESLITALQLRAEQERTKQEFYRLELSKKVLEIMKEAMVYNVPPDKLNELFSHLSLNSSTASPLRTEHTHPCVGSNAQNPAHSPTPLAPARHPLSSAALAAAAAVSVGSSSGDLPPSITHTNHKRHQSQPVVQHPVPISPGGGIRYKLESESEPCPPQFGLSKSASTTSKAAPRHAKHSSITSSYTPGSPTRTAYSSKAAWACPPQPLTHFPPPQPSTNGIGTAQPTAQAANSSPGIQFHHWQPASTGSRPDSDEQVIKRRRSISERTSSPTPSQPPFAYPTISSSKSHSSHLNHILGPVASKSRPYSHAKHRSETFVHNRPWIATPTRYPELAQPTPRSPVKSPVLTEVVAQPSNKPDLKFLISSNTKD